MNPEQLRDLAVNALEETKGIDILTIDVRTLTSMTDYMIICTGQSTRHVKTLADNVSIKAKQMKVSYIKTEGEKECEWILVDLGDIVVHVMLSTTRNFYALEDLWQPIKNLRDKNE